MEGWRGSRAARGTPAKPPSRGAPRGADVRRCLAAAIEADEGNGAPEEIRTPDGIVITLIELAHARDGFERRSHRDRHMSP